MEGWVDLGGWLHRLLRWFTCPQTVTHPRSNRARRRTTSLIETKALTTTPRRHGGPFVPHVQASEIFWVCYLYFVVRFLLYRSYRSFLTFFVRILVYFQQSIRQIKLPQHWCKGDQQLQILNPPYIPTTSYFFNTKIGKNDYISRCAKFG